MNAVEDPPRRGDEGAESGHLSVMHGPTVARHLERAARTAPIYRRDRVDTDTEVVRLRSALAALLSWPGEAGPAEMDRRKAWCHAIAEQCGRSDWRGWIEAACRVGASSLAGVKGVAVTVVSGQDPEVLTASDPWTSRAQEWELTVGEGPSVSARADNRIVVVEDLATAQGAWVGYASGALVQDVRGVIGIPLRMHGTCVGSLTLYYRGPVSSGVRNDLLLASAFADIATVALVADIERLRCGDPAGNALFSVHVATGAMATRLGIPLGEAESRLRAHAFSGGVSLVDAAQWLIDGEDDIA